MPRTARRSDRGFTLIELLVVVIVIGILAGIAIPLYLHQKASATDATVKSDLKNLATAIEADDTLVGVLMRAPGNTAVKGTIAGTLPVTMTSGTGWSVAGTRAAYCLTAYATHGTATATAPVTLDSRAAGIGRSGGACNLAALPVMGAPVAATGGYTVTAARNLLPDSAWEQVAPAKLNGVPSVTSADGNVSQFGALWRYVDMQTPWTTRAMELTQTSGSAQGTILNPSETVAAPASVPRLVQGSTYQLSVWLKAPAGVVLKRLARVVSPVTQGWIAEAGSTETVTATGDWQQVTWQYTADGISAGNVLALQIQTRTGFAPIGTVWWVAAPQVELLVPGQTAPSPFEVTP